MKQSENETKETSSMTEQLNGWSNEVPTTEGRYWIGWKTEDGIFVIGRPITAFRWTNDPTVHIEGGIRVHSRNFYYLPCPEPQPPVVGFCVGAEPIRRADRASVEYAC